MTPFRGLKLRTADPQRWSSISMLNTIQYCRRITYATIGRHAPNWAHSPSLAWRVVDPVTSSFKVPHQGAAGPVHAGSRAQKAGAAFTCTQDSPLLETGAGRTPPQQQTLTNAQGKCLK